MPTETVSPGITRFEFDNRKGYMVRIKRGKKRINEWYPDKKHGGKRKTLTVAKSRYAELLDELGPIKPSTKNRITVRNTSGHVGVHLDDGYDARWGSYNESYVASWLTEEGRRAKIGFSIKKYGKKKAFDLACIAREEYLKDREKVVSLYDRRKKKGGSVTRKIAKRKPR